MSMLIECKMCHHTYGAWRPQCTACGHKTPRQEPINTPRLIERKRREKREVTKRVKELCATACAFCRVRGAKEKCRTCGSLVHSTCRILHHDAVHSTLPPRADDGEATQLLDRAFGGELLI